MNRHYVPYLFLAAALLSVGAALTVKHPNWFRVAASMVHVLIALAYVPHHHFR